MFLKAGLSFVDDEEATVGMLDISFSANHLICALTARIYRWAGRCGAVSVEIFGGKARFSGGLQGQSCM